MIGVVPSSIGGQAAFAAYVFALVMAAVNDWRSLRIPNWLTGALAVAFPVAAMLVGHDVQWLSHLAAGLAVFVGAAVLFMLRMIGGGDVKLLGATALWTGLGQVVPLLMLVAVIGGVFALVVLLLRHPFVHAVMLAVLRRLPAFTEAKTPIPYGIPIAIAGIALAPTLSFLS
jgi:prepilin peptidase CpaA